MDLFLIVVLIIILAAEFVNGLSDAPNAIATAISTRVLTPYRAVILAAVMNIVGALVTGTFVADTISKNIVLLPQDATSLAPIGAAVLTVVVWTTITWKYGIPTSETHELVAGLAGAGLATAGFSALFWEGWRKVLIGLLMSTVLGFVAGFLIMVLIYWIFRRTNAGTVNAGFSKMQIGSTALLAFSHGSNDGQKFMGVFTLALFLKGVIPSLAVPMWVVLLCSVVMGIGTISGGWRIIRTIGFNITRLEPVHGFAAQCAAGISILLGSRFGIPLSTTHTINTAVMGVGSTRRLSAVRWGVSRQIVLTWVVTFPVCFVLGYLFALLFKVIV
ncbi:MAG: inorganic phosphate transporter [Chloroflexi bacterium]|nr:inorganic phosphate transporter [Chloroflexota bacterium]